MTEGVLTGPAGGGSQHEDEAGGCGVHLGEIAPGVTAGGENESRRNILYGGDDDSRVLRNTCGCGRELDVARGGRAWRQGLVAQKETLPGRGGV